VQGGFALVALDTLCQLVSLQNAAQVLIVAVKKYPGARGHRVQCSGGSINFSQGCRAARAFANAARAARKTLA
jgi:hypothetical protein